jgi:hypothetical protein
MAPLSTAIVKVLRKSEGLTMGEIVNKIRESRFVWSQRENFTACVVQAIHHLTDDGVLIRVQKDKKNFIFQLNEKAV